jgi:hypothetical protein
MSKDSRWVFIPPVTWRLFDSETKTLYSLTQRTYYANETTCKFALRGQKPAIRSNTHVTDYQLIEINVDLEELQQTEEHIFDYIFKRHEDEIFEKAENQIFSPMGLLRRSLTNG